MRYYNFLKNKYQNKKVVTLIITITIYYANLEFAKQYIIFKFINVTDLYFYRFYGVGGFGSSVLSFLVVKITVPPSFTFSVKDVTTASSSLGPSIFTSNP